MKSQLTLNDVCIAIVDTKHKTPKFTDSGYPCIRTPNIGRGNFILNGAKYVSEETYKEWIERVVPSENDLILAREAPVGNVAILPNNLKVCHGQRTVLIRPNPEKVDPNFLMYTLLSDEVQFKMYSMASGATVPHLNMSDIRKLELPELPSLYHQKKLSRYIKNYDLLIENNNRRIAILEEIAQSLYREWFVKFRYPGNENLKLVESPLGLIPEGWEFTKLDELVTLRRKTAKKGKLKDLIPYMGLEHFPRKSIALSDWDTVYEIGSNKLEFKKGDILFGKIRPYFHKVGVAQTDGICSTDTFVMCPNNELHHPLIAMVTFSDEFVAQAVQTSQGTKMPRANWDVLSEYFVAIPPKDILLKFNSVISPAINNIAILSAKNRNLKTQRDMLLPKLISGQISLNMEGS